jgi:hypothetical protein
MREMEGNGMGNHPHWHYARLESDYLEHVINLTAQNETIWAQLQKLSGCMGKVFRMAKTSSAPAPATPSLPPIQAINEGSNPLHLSGSYIAASSPTEEPLEAPQT